MTTIYYNQKSDKSFDGSNGAVHEEIIRLGDKGLFIKVYHKDKNDVYKIMIIGKDGDFTMKTSKGKDSDVKEKKMSKAEVIKEIKKNDKLAFASDFAEKFESSISRLGSRKGSRKSTNKKGSRKGSSRKSTSRKGSKK